MTPRVSILGCIFLISPGLSIAASAPVTDASERADTVKAAPTTIAQRDARRPGAARGPLPDPTLLDGSTQQAEKKNEQGMLGEFELPGDENSKSGKVGGQQPPQGTPGGAGSRDAKDGAPPAGAQGAQAATAAGGGAAQADGKPAPAGAAGGSAGPADANGQTGGIQVAELSTDQSNGAQGAAGAGEKPKPVALGDSAMQIKSVSNAAGVVGSQPAGSTQQMEKAVGGAAKGTSGSNANKGVEKGRAIPAGL